MKLRLKIYDICTAIILVLCAVFFVACNDEPENIYAKDNNFVVRTTDTEDSLEFCPVGITPTYGIIFYVGGFVAPEYYTYLGESLAKQGYLVVIPKLENNMAYNDYKQTEAAFAKYPNVKFFVGGHDMGGGAAVRRAMECADNIKGVLLYAPIGFAKQKFENGKLVFDENGDPVWEQFTIADKHLPTLLLEVDDTLRTEELKNEAKNHINVSNTKDYTIENSNAICFSAIPTATLSEEQAKAQRTATVEYTLAFLKDTVTK